MEALLIAVFPFVKFYLFIAFQLIIKNTLSFYVILIEIKLRKGIAPARNVTELDFSGGFVTEQYVAFAYYLVFFFFEPSK
jgi:hypothetical protein